MSVILDIRDPLPRAALHHLAEQVFGWLHTVDALFSTQRDDSQVNLLDQGLLRPGRADPLVREVLTTCALLNERTEGYFDIHATGLLDPSGYVKGWALQRASALLTQGAAPNHQLRAGGDVYAAGQPESGRPWQVAVDDPFRPNAAAWIVPATDLGVATSAGHEARGHDVHNPWARRPASGLTSVTVAGPDLGTAAAYATAAYAMGPAAHDWLARLEGHAFAIIDDHGRRFHGWLSGLVLAV